MADIVRTIAVGILFVQLIILSTIAVILIFVQLSFPTYNEYNEYGKWQKDIDQHPTFYWIVITACLLGCLFALLVLYGIAKCQPYWMLPWLFYCLLNTFFLVVLIILKIVSFDKDHTLKDILLLILILVIPLYAMFIMALLWFKMAKRRRLGTLC